MKELSLPSLLLNCTPLLFSVAFLASGCAKTTNNPNAEFSSGTVDSPILTALTGLSSIQQGLDDAENSPLASASANFDQSFGVSASACPSSRSACASQSRSINFDDCRAGAFSAKGTIILSYNTAQSCSDSLNGLISSGTQVLRLIPNLSLERSSMTNRITTDPQTTYAGITIGGGQSIQITGVQSYTLNILGLTWERSVSILGAIFSHSITSTQPIIVTGSRTTNNRNIGSGRVSVYHNKARYIADIRYFNLAYDNGSCYPRTGLITSSLSGSTTSRISMTFTAGRCGQVELSTEDSSNNQSTLQIDLPDCS